MKNRILIPIIALALMLKANITNAQDSTLSIGGQISYDNISYFNSQKGKVNSRNEGLLQLNFGSAMSKSTQWKAIFELREDNSDKSRNRAWIDELWIKQKLGKLDLTIGKQILAWGTADGFNPVNNINPVDYSDMLDTENERIGAYGIRTQLFFNSADFDFFWAPIASMGKLPNINSRWFPQPTAIGIPMELFAMGLEMKVNEILPEPNLKNGEFGVRFRKRFSIADIGVSYYNGFDHLPEFYIDSTQLMLPTPQLVLNGVFKRQHVVGSELTVILPYGINLRNEAALFIPAQSNPQLNRFVQVVVGVDRSFTISSTSYLVILQYIGDFNADGKAYDSYDIRHIFKNTLMANFEINLSNGLSLNAAAITYLNGNGFILRPEINYLTSKGVKLCLRFDLIEGSNNSFFGMYSFNDRIQGKVVYSF
jgi:hypothetical protein